MDRHFFPLALLGFAISALFPSAPAARTATWFKTDALQALVAKERNGAILLWSPHMQLSVRAVEEARLAAKAQGLPFTPLMDPLADQESAERVVRERGWSRDLLKRAQGTDPTLRKANLHYPALFVYRGGQVCGDVQRGYRTSEQYQAILKSLYEACAE